jgi:hypothetical protein
VVGAAAILSCNVNAGVRREQGFAGRTASAHYRSPYLIFDQLIGWTHVE